MLNEQGARNKIDIAHLSSTLLLLETLRYFELPFDRIELQFE